MRENEFHRWLKDAGLSAGRHVLIGHGDDMACVVLGGQKMLIGSDMLLEGRHFCLDSMTPEQVGRKALACCLSDCAAMAVEPVAAVVSLALRKGGGDVGQRVLSGMRELVEAFHCPIVGGDTVSWDQPMAVDVVVLARALPQRDPVRRDGAKIGDLLCVTGSLGGSLLGKHWSFRPRVFEAVALAELFGSQLHAMMDLSDGPAMDLPRMCEASSVGAMLDEESLLAVASPDARRMAADDGRSLLAHVLEDGEDFELLLAVSGAEIPETVNDCPLHVVGEIVENAGIRLRRRDGSQEPLRDGGYEHVF